MKNVHVILYDRWKDKKKRWHPLRSTFSTTSWDSFRLSHRQGYGTENSSFFRPATAKPICSEEVWVFNSFPQWTTSGSSTVLTSLPHLPARALCSHLFECPQHPTDLTPLDSFIAKCWRTYKLLDNLAMPWTSLPEGATTRAFPIHIAREGGIWWMTKKSPTVTSPLFMLLFFSSTPTVSDFTTSSHTNLW